jgi:hypothetical protein
MYAWPAIKGLSFRTTRIRVIREIRGLRFLKVAGG